MVKAYSARKATMLIVFEVVFAVALYVCFVAYGPQEMELGYGESRLIQVSSIFVSSVKVRGLLMDASTASLRAMINSEFMEDGSRA
jgi:hypothetical protein